MEFDILCFRMLSIGCEQDLQIFGKYVQRGTYPHLIVENN